MDALSATFVDLRTVKGRKMCQLILEVPVEQAKDAIDLLGFPRPDTPQWVGIAPLAAKPGDGTATDRQKPEQRRYRLVKLAAVLCGDGRFQAWLSGGSPTYSEEDAAMWLRAYLGITSRRELATNPDAAAKFEALVARYKQETGQMAEARP